MSPQAHNFYAGHREVQEILDAAEKAFFKATITIERPLRINSSSGWISFDFYLMVQEEEGGPWLKAAKLFKQAPTLPKMSLSGYEADERTWSKLLGTLQTIDEELKTRLSPLGDGTSHSSASPSATQTNGNSSPYSGASSATPGPSSTSAPQATNPVTPSQPGIKPLVAFANTTDPDSIKQPQP